jgi:hypothetical protein
MLVFTIVLLVFVIEIAIAGVILYFLWKKVGKNLYQFIKKITNPVNNTPVKPPKLSHFQEQLNKINEILKNSHKK